MRATSHSHLILFDLIILISFWRVTVIIVKTITTTAAAVAANTNTTYNNTMTTNGRMIEDNELEEFERRRSCLNFRNSLRVCVEKLKQMDSEKPRPWETVFRSVQLRTSEPRLSA
jgi:hypothetical protein